MRENFMNEKVFKNLISVEKINLINEAVKEEGFNSIDIYAPFESNRDKIHFLVSTESLNLTMFEQLGLHQKIKEILEVNEIMLDNKASYNEEDLNFYFEERCEFSQENIEKIKNLYKQDNIIEDEKEPYFNSKNTLFKPIEKNGEKKRKLPSSSDSDVEDSQKGVKKSKLTFIEETESDEETTDEEAIEKIKKLLASDQKIHNKLIQNPSLLEKVREFYQHLHDVKEMEFDGSVIGAKMGVK